MQLSQLTAQVYQSLPSFSLYAMPVFSELASVASSAVAQVAAIDPSVAQITSGVALVSMGVTGFARSQIVDKLKEVITGKESVQSKAPSYALAAASSGAVALGAFQIYNGSMEIF